MELALGTGSTLATSALAVSVFCDINPEPTVLCCVAQRIPHVVILQLYKIITPLRRFSSARHVRCVSPAFPGITPKTLLAHFGALRVVKFFDFSPDEREEAPEEELLEEDRRITAMPSDGKVRPLLNPEPEPGVQLIIPKVVVELRNKSVNVPGRDPCCAEMRGVPPVTTLRISKAPARKSTFGGSSRALYGQVITGHAA
ncbi:hypothetical protein B0H17DRAFT_1137296 [Mycena rosella]|uniref:Uncharacterized protein n=1 Tax=Mycena rosella TaxID=1033263 RepID=A0AAD7D9I7_MYCRO|nr:hypothetical protein B0H17DRAFT_1137296 [Mycena rosella]